MSPKPASGRFLLRVSPALHRALRRRAQEAGASLNRFCGDVLEASVEGGAGGQSPAAAAAAAAVVKEVGDELEGVILFGSRAEGCDGPGSDTDLLLVLRSGAAVGRRRYAAWDAALAGRSCIKALGPRVSPHFACFPAGRPGTENGGGVLWLEAALHGIVLWQRSPALSRWLAEARELMAEGVLRRRRAHGQPYWTRATEGAHEEPYLAAGYLRRARSRLKAVGVLMDEESWADVVRESQEVVEICLKAVLRRAGVDPPRIHDVSGVLVENRTRLPARVRRRLDDLVRISRALRRDRELAFYGSEDLTPSQFYDASDARDAFESARFVYETADGEQA